MAVIRDVGRAQRLTARQARYDLSQYSDHKFWSYPYDNPDQRGVVDDKAKAALQAAYDKISKLMKQEGLLP